jgi:hypothetical protein
MLKEGRQEGVDKAHEEVKDLRIIIIKRGAA